MTSIVTYRVLPKNEQVCLPCNTGLVPTGEKIPGARTYRCQECKRTYSDYVLCPDQKGTQRKKLWRQKQKEENERKTIALRG